MIYQKKFQIGLEDIGKENGIKNKAILGFLETIGGYHSDLAGYGVNDIEETGVTWILADWKLEVKRRPKYGEVLEVHTWGRGMTRVSTYRDFEIYDENHEVCVIATSKWALIDIKKGKITRITEELAKKYEPEEKYVFLEPDLDRLKIPENYESILPYQVLRKDIDMNNHMHNLYYLDLAYEVLPEEVYLARPFDQVRISYKKEMKLGDTVICKYVFEEGKHCVGIYSEDDTILHAMIQLF